MKLCIIEKCDRVSKKINMCLAHYQRWKRHGENFERSLIMDVKSLEGRFNAKVGKLDENGCKEWTGWKNKDGYGKFSINNKYRFAHRVMWEISYGPIPKGFCVLHKCDNSSCVNLEHLFLGTHDDNMKDMSQKNRAFNKKGINPFPENKGSNHPLSLLDEAKVRQIKIKLRDGIKGAVIAREYKVCDQTIYEIKNGKNWRHVII